MSRISEKLGYVPKNGDRSYFKQTPHEDFHENASNLKALLYPLGAAIYNNDVQIDYLQLSEPIEVIGYRKKFDHKKYIYKNTKLAFNYLRGTWKHDGVLYNGVSYVNKKIDFLDSRKLFIKYEGDLNALDYSDDTYYSTPYFTLYKPYKDDDLTGSINAPNIKYLEYRSAIKIRYLNLKSLVLILSFLKEGNADREYLDKIFAFVADIVKKRIFERSSGVTDQALLLSLSEDYYKHFTDEEIDILYYKMLSKDYVINKTEDTIIKLINVKSNRRNFDSTKFLKNLLTNKVRGEIELIRLYNKMNDYGGKNNFSLLMITLFRIWYDSDYKKYNYPEYKKYNQPPDFTYTQNKFFGFRSDKYDFSFDEKANVIAKAEPFDSDSIPEYIISEIIQIFTKGEKYHPFQPLNLTELKETKNEEIILDELIPIPAFYLKAFDDKGAWENFEKNVWLAIDLLSIYSGFAGLARLRFLLKAGTLKSGNLLLKLRLAYGTIDVTADIISVALSFVDNCDNSPFCKKLQQYLFWLQVCTFGADALSSRILRDQAKELKEALEVYRLSKKAEKADDLDTLEKHLDEVSIRYNIVSFFEGTALTALQLQAWERKIKILSRNKCRFKSANNNQKILREMEKDDVLAYFEAGTPPPTIWYREGITEYIAYHEFFHAEEFYKIGKKEFLKGVNGTDEQYLLNELFREKYVYEKILENAEKFSEKELKHAKDYYLTFLIKLNENNIEIKPEYIVK